MRAQFKPEFCALSLCVEQMQVQHMHKNVSAHSLFVSIPLCSQPGRTSQWLRSQTQRLRLSEQFSKSPGCRGRAWRLILSGRITLTPPGPPTPLCSTAVLASEHQCLQAAGAVHPVVQEDLPLEGSVFRSSLRGGSHPVLPPPTLCLDLWKILRRWRARLFLARFEAGIT